MQIADDRTRVTGVVCYSESGHLIYRDVPVTGAHPRVSFTLGGRFDEGIFSPDTLSGTWYAGPYQDQWLFQKAAPSAYEVCRSLRP